MAKWRVMVFGATEFQNKRFCLLCPERIVYFSTCPCLSLNHCLCLRRVLIVSKNKDPGGSLVQYSKERLTWSRIYELTGVGEVIKGLKGREKVCVGYSWEWALHSAVP